MKKLAFVLLPFAVACGGSSTPWEADAAIIHSADGSTSTLSAGTCAELENGDCVDTTKECGEGATADVYLDAKGNVASIVCYPTEGATLTLDGTSEIPPDVDNKDFIVIGGDLENPGFTGNIDLSGNNSTLYGTDPATSVLDGNLTVSKNNVLVSGITITGDVTIEFNNALFSNCVIKGNLTITGNDAVVAGCHVEGNISLSGNNTELSVNRVDGNIEISGNGTVCTDNYSTPEYSADAIISCVTK